MKNPLPQNWNEIRQVVLKRDNYQCVICTDNGTLDVHHVHPKYFGGSHHPSNLISLCRKCHTDRHIDLQIKLGRIAIIKIAYFFKYFIAEFRKQPLSDINYIYLLKQLTGSTKFREGQEEIINEIMKGNDVLVVMPTGMGKSMCFQLPAIANDKQSLVICPLITLMRDQVQNLQKKWIPATFLNSQLSDEELKGRIEFLKKNYFKLFYVAPERFKSQKLINKELQNIPIGLFIVDEAHTIDKWGKDFRTAYSELGHIRTIYNNPQTLAFTATANERTRNEIISSLRLNNPKVIVKGFDRPNIIFRVVKINFRQFSRDDFPVKFPYLKQLLNNVRGKTVIFVPTIKTGEKIVNALKKINQERKEYNKRNSIEEKIEDVELMHSKLDPLIKTYIQDRFTGNLQPELNILVSTSAFSMGVDVKSIRFIIHWTHSSSIDDYFQEVGRAGRDGNPALAILLKVDGDHSINDFLIKMSLQSMEDEVAKAKRLKDKSEDLLKIITYSKIYDCRRKYILRYFGEIIKERNWFIKLLIKIFLRKKKFCCDNCDKKATLNNHIQYVNNF